MPPSRSSAARSAPARRTAAPAAAPPAAPQRQPGPRKVKSHGGPLSRIRWDRASRVAMVGVLIIIAVLWISGISSLLSHHSQAEGGLAQVHRLAAENKALVSEKKALHQRATILDRARDLGMVKQGEQAFIVTH